MIYNKLAITLLNNGFTPDQLISHAGLAIGADNQLIMENNYTDVLVLHNEATNEVALLETEPISCLALANLKEALTSKLIEIMAIVAV